MPSRPSAEQYRLGYRWLIQGPIERVFHYVTEGNAVTQWWPQFRWAVMEPSQPRVGAHLRARVKSLLPYQLYWEAVVNRIEAPHLVEYETELSLSHRFRFTGRIRYTFHQRNAVVEVVNEQVMVPERSLPRPLRPLAQMLISFNHGYAMKRGGKGLQEIVRRDVVNR